MPAAITHLHGESGVRDYILKHLLGITELI